MELIEKRGDFLSGFARWGGGDNLAGYPWVENVYAPFTPVRRALPMLNLALISSAGAYIDATQPFDLASRDGDTEIREFPIEIEAADLRYAAKGFDTKAVIEDRNVQIPIERLLEYEANAVIGRLNDVWWSLSPWIPNATRVVDEMAPRLAERLARYEVSAALLIPASRLCHQTMGLLARGIEAAGIPTMVISVDKGISENIRAPRTAYYNGEIGSVAGKPNWREYQLRILDEALRWTETFDQPGSRKLAVDLETQIQAARGER
ncbi:MAG TPA: glycine/sarcosine/betaine reductase selenoprotein B family protein [Pyrinomonadaceae bacterium]|nr:glycine/sarcosine/betaine reductase selenoprotein B family protein [Pyrinomonadaceae bacterium]